MSMWSWINLILKPLKCADIPPLKGHTELFHCERIINCNSFLEDTPETWLLEGI